jgi:hypothetical protein
LRLRSGLKSAVFDWYAKAASDPAEFFKQRIERTDPYRTRLARYLLWYSVLDGSRSFVGTKTTR